MILKTQKNIMFNQSLGSKIIDRFKWSTNVFFVIVEKSQSWPFEAVLKQSKFGFHFSSTQTSYFCQAFSFRWESKFFLSFFPNLFGMRNCNLKLFLDVYSYWGQFFIFCSGWNGSWQKLKLDFQERFLKSRFISLL